MRKMYVLLLSMLLLGGWGVLMPGTAFAVGFGIYASGAFGDAHERYAAGEDNARHLEGGLVFDTGVGNNHPLRYRLHLGYSHTLVESDVRADDRLRAVTVDNYLGFRLVRGERAELWTGPDLMLGGYVGKYDGGPVLGLGGAVGVDVALSPDLTLAFIGGYHDIVNISIWNDLTEHLVHFDVALLWGKRAAW